jgi:Glycosyltransferase family 87
MFRAVDEDMLATTHSEGAVRNWKALLLLLPVVVYLVVLCVRAPESRLYWEYAGRINHQAITQGYPEWVQHPKGQLTPPEGTIRRDRALAPYTDFSSEYPPGAILLFAAVRLAFDGLSAFSVAFNALAAVSILIAVLVMVRLIERRFDHPVAPAPIILAFTIWVVLTGGFVVIRFDSIVVLFTAFALLAWDGRRKLLAGFCLGLGASIKLWPAFLVPILALSRPPGSRATPPAFLDVLPLSIGALVGFALPHGIVLAIGTSPADLLGYLSYFRDRPPEVESLQANLLAVGHILGIITAQPSFDFGSHNVIADNWQTPAFMFSLSFVVAYLGALICMLRADDSRAIEPFLMGFVVITLILCSKVFSGEYLIWMLPFVLLAVGARRWGIACMYAIALLLLRATYIHWHSATTIQPLGTLLIALKNVACILMASLFFRELVRISRKPVNRSPPLASQSS